MSSSSSYEENDLSCTPLDIKCEAFNVMESLLPENSKDKYLLAYQKFIEWQNDKNTQSFSEKMFMAYFKELSTKYKPSSLWCIYSMLKSTVGTNNGVDLKTYSNLLAYLKRQSDGFTSKKSKVLSYDNIEKFIKDAPDNRYLATKVALIFGVTGACKMQELTNITVKDIENHGQILLVKIPNSKNKIPRSFTIHGPFYEIVKKYERLRPPKVKTDRFFLNYQNGKCTCQPIGINKFGSMPKEIAKFLNLADAESYTGHSFRKTSATLLAKKGVDIMTLKRHGGWRSNNVAESDVDDSIQNKKEICAKVTKRLRLDSEEHPTVNNLPDETMPSKTIMLLEVCVDSLESAINAVHGGADELEVCSSLTEGGLTPSPGLVKVIIEMVNNIGRNPIRKSCHECSCDVLTKRPKVNVMIRCRTGLDFNYSEEEMDTMLYDIDVFKFMGVDRFVFGALTKDQYVDEVNCKKVIARAYPKPVTFHRAFDVCVNYPPITTVETIHALGFNRLLTSGQEDRADAVEAVKLLKSLIETVGDKIEIMPGAGIKLHNLSTFIEMGCKIIHSSCKNIRYMPKIENGLRMGTNDSEHIYVTDEATVMRMKFAIS